MEGRRLVLERLIRRHPREPDLRREGGAAAPEAPGAGDDHQQRLRPRGTRRGPLQAAYCAAKHDIVKGFTEALRLRAGAREGVVINVTPYALLGRQRPSSDAPGRSSASSLDRWPPSTSRGSCRGDPLRRRAPAAGHHRRQRGQDAGGDGAHQVTPRPAHAARGAMFEMQKTDRADDGHDNLFDHARARNRLFYRRIQPAPQIHEPLHPLPRAAPEPETRLARPGRGGAHAALDV